MTMGSSLWRRKTATIQELLPGSVFLSRVLILTVCLGLLWPSAGLAAYQPAVYKEARRYDGEVSGWGRLTGSGGWAGFWKGAQVSDPGMQMELAKTASATKKKG